MFSGLDIRVLSFASASAREQDRGLLGWLSVEIDGLLLVDSIAFRRTSAGKPALSWPARRDRNGHDHPIVRPVDDVARRQLERQILDALEARS